MQLTMLGTGNAQATNCFNTCFVLQDENGCILVDGGGGNRLFVQLEKAGFDWKDMHDIFVTHKHIDHLLGIVWMIRMILQNMRAGKYEGEARIYAHEEVIRLLTQMATDLLPKKDTAGLGTRLHLITVEDGETRIVAGHEMTFFDIHSTKAKQFGFRMEYETGQYLTCCGDEPCPEECLDYVRGSRWLLHEAFCLYEDRDIFHPYEKNHSTVKDAAQLAERCSVPHAVFYHTEDKHMETREETYLAEGRTYYSGDLHVPNDLTTIRL